MPVRSATLAHLEMQSVLSWFRRRDLAIYPKDEIGDALYEKHPRPDRMPPRLGFWYDVYFDNEADAQAFQRFGEGRSYAIETDHDETYVEDGLGPWCVMMDVATKANHRDLLHLHRDVMRAAQDYRGKVATWMLTIPEDEH